MTYRKVLDAETPPWGNMAHSGWISPITFKEWTGQYWDVLLSCCDPQVFKLQQSVYEWHGGEKLMFLLSQGVLRTGKVQHSNSACRGSWLVHWTISTQDLGLITEGQLKW